eukprot:3244969-Prymnesium_polylepis.1
MSSAHVHEVRTFRGIMNLINTESANTSTPAAIGDDTAVEATQEVLTHVYACALRYVMSVPYNPRVS